MCRYGGANFLLGDEMHLVFECTALQDLRNAFAPIFEGAATMQQFMWQPNLLQVSRFLDASMKRFRAIDPNDGSDI